MRRLLRFVGGLRPATLRRRAWEDGLLGGDPRWLLVGGLAWGVWLLRWAWRKEPEVVYRTRLRGDEQVVITSRSPTGRGT